MKQYGLHIDQEGTVLLGEKPFYGYGINLFSSFCYLVDSHYEGREESFYKEDLALCKAYNLPLARMLFSTWGDNSYRMFDKDRETFFRLLDLVVAEAETQQIGIIASLFWCQDTLPYYVGEKRSAYGNPDSKTVAFAKRYTTAIIERYNDSPAIWGWELGNEYNLNADMFVDYALPYEVFKRGKWSREDYYTSGDARHFYTVVAETIRKTDKYRLITNGNAAMRPQAKFYRQIAGHTTTPDVYYQPLPYDTYDDFCEMNAWFCPDPMDTISFHFQHATLNGDPPQFKMTRILGGETVNTKEYLDGYIAMGRKLKKAVYYGEFGDFLDMEVREDAPLDECRKKWKEVLQALIDSGIQLATGWFNWPWVGGRLDHTLNQVKSYINDVRMPDLKKINEDFRKKGLQPVEEYWSR